MVAEEGTSKSGIGGNEDLRPLDDRASVGNTTASSTPAKSEGQVPTSAPPASANETLFNLGASLPPTANPVSSSRRSTRVTAVPTDTLFDLDDGGGGGLDDVPIPEVEEYASGALAALMDSQGKDGSAPSNRSTRTAGGLHSDLGSGAGVKTAVIRSKLVGLTEPNRYRYSGEFARGGMGRILLATDETVGRTVAVKELLANLTGDEDDEFSKPASRRGVTIVERFLREAKITGCLEHPNIVPVYEIGRRKDGQWYYTMKYVRGETLASKLRSVRDNAEMDERAKLAERLKLLPAFIDVCNAIAYAHSKGVIHRDLKPENIMIGEFGETVILDWGLARVKGEEGSLANPPPKEALAEALKELMQLQEDGAPRLTHTGSILGTPSYMSPEQARGELDELDERSDVFSMGVILYEIVAGVRAYDGKVIADILERVATQPPPPIEERAPNIPEELAWVVHKACAFAHEERFANIKLLADEVEAWRNGLALASYKYSVRDNLRRIYKRQKPAVFMGAALLVAIICASVWLLVLNAEAVSARDEALAQQARAERGEREAIEQGKLREEALQREASERLSKEEALTLQKQAEASAAEARRQTQLAEANAEEARKQTQIAETNAEEARKQTQIAERQAQIAIEQGRLREEALQREASERLSKEEALTLQKQAEASAEVARQALERTEWATGERPLAQLIARRQVNISSAGVAVSPDGQWAVSATRKGTLRAWNVQPRNSESLEAAERGDGALMATDSKAHGDSIVAVLYVLAADSERPGFVSIGGRWIKKWSISTEGKLVLERTGSLPTSASVAASHGGTAMVGTDDGRLFVWHAGEETSGVVPLAITPPSGGVSAIAFQPLPVPTDHVVSEVVLLVGTSRGRVSSWTLSTPDGWRPTADRMDWRMEHRGGVSALALSPDGRLAASSGEDGRTLVWEVSAPDPQPLEAATPLGPNDTRCASLAFTADSRFVVAGGPQVGVHSFWQIQKIPGTDREQLVEVRRVTGFESQSTTYISLSSPVATDTTRQFAVISGARGRFELLAINRPTPDALLRPVTD